MAGQWPCQALASHLECVIRKMFRCANESLIPGVSEPVDFGGETSRGRLQ
jgi:hypothetical protein